MNAWIEYGRWIVPCANPDCEAVLFADRSECECHDETVCDHPSIPCAAPIIAGYPAGRVTIERLLNNRPRRMNRFWLLGETVEDLTAQNLLHGVKI